MIQYYIEPDSSTRWALTYMHDHSGQNVSTFEIILYGHQTVDSVGKTMCRNLFSFRLPYLFMLILISTYRPIYGIGLDWAPVALSDFYKTHDNDNSVPYFTPQERELYRVTLKDGLFYANDGRLLNSHRSIFVMDLEGNLYTTAAISKETMDTHSLRIPRYHSSFLAG